MDNMNVRPADIKAQVSARKEEDKDVRAVSKILDMPSPAEKVSIQMAQQATAAGTLLSGGDHNQAVAQATAVGEAVARTPHDQSINELIAALPGNSEFVDVAAGLTKAQAGQETQEGKARTTAFADQIGASFMEMTALPVLFRTIERNIKTPPADPNFDYMAIRDEAERGLMESDRQFLRESSSAEDLEARLSEVRTRQERYATLGAHGTGMAVAAGLAGGLIDPVGWAATLGVGKVAQMAGVGARAAAAAGDVGRTMAYGATEGVIGNVLTEAALDAAGAHVTPNDYLIAAGFGVIFGQTALLALKRPVMDDIGPVHGADGEPPAPAPRTDIMGEGADYQLKDGTRVVATIRSDKHDDRTIALHTTDGRPVGDALYAAAEHKIFPTPHVADEFRRKGANTLMYDLIQEHGGYAGFREDLKPARTPDGIAFWGSYETGQSKQWRNAESTGHSTDPITAAQDIVNNGQAMNKDLYAEAQGRLPVDATPEQIRAEVDKIVLEQADFVNNTAFADVPEIDRILPRIDEAMNADGTVKPIDDALSDPALRADTEARWGIDETTVEDSANRMMMGEVAARAEAWSAANPVNPERIDSIMAKAPWAASTGLILARSQNPVARMIAGTLLESTTGAFGRRRTAAVSKTMRERVYLEDLVNYETSYKQWRNKNGGNAMRDVLGSDTRTNFDRAVALERENRRLGGVRSDDPSIRHAADALDSGYNRMRQDQQNAGTVGASRLGDTSVGYVHRAISQSWVMRATNPELKALSNKLAEQLEVGWADAKFAQQIAARYIERARTGAYGGTSVPANLASPEAASALRDTLRSMSIAEVDIEKAMGRFSRGGASHTKKRLELDLSERISTDDGRSFSMMDAFEFDQASLYLQYARRVSGDVALTQYGVMGDAGLKMLRKTMEYGPDGQRATAVEMRAFDQIAAEFHGRPLDGSGNKHLGNLRMLTASSRLGGMAFTQMAELANGVALLGVVGSLKHVGRMPGLVADVAKGRPSALLSSIEQIGGPLGQDHRVVFPFQEPNDIKVYGRDSFNVFDRIVRAGSNALPWLSGWHMVHAAQVRGISEQIVHKSMRFIRNGEENAALTSMGIGPELAGRLRNDLNRIAEFDADGNLTALDLTKGTDHAAIGEFVQAIHRGGKQIIQGTYIGETGAWAHNDLLRMLVQFRSFSITSMEKQWTRQRVDVGTAKAFGLLMGQMAFALPIHLSRVAINATGREDKEDYLETQLHPAMLARAVLNYTSISGLAGDVLDAGASFTGYEGSGVRSGSASALGNIPSLGYLESGAKVFKQRDAREAIRMLPGGNLPFLTPIVNAAAQD